MNQTYGKCCLLSTSTPDPLYISHSPRKFIDSLIFRLHFYICQIQTFIKWKWLFWFFCILSLKQETIWCVVHQTDDGIAKTYIAIANWMSCDGVDMCTLPTDTVIRFFVRERGESWYFSRANFLDVLSNNNKEKR